MMLRKKRRMKKRRRKIVMKRGTGRRRKRRKEKLRMSLMKMIMSSCGTTMCTIIAQSKKFKRLKKAQRDSDEDRYGFSDDEFDESGKGGRTAEEKLKRSLFGVPLEDMPEEEEQEEVEEDADIGDEDEMADFIVDEDDEDGTLVRS
uniref:Spt6 acidic N-terminal domain-containing protein n=1 Tax=Salix viminalis TaxID=40686 RepID=A0A6N2KSX7_SALVM